MYKIGTYNKIAKKGLNKFSDKYEIVPEFEKPDGIILRSYNLLEQKFNDNLLAIARAGAGVNNIPVDRCTEEGIVAFNTPGANANAVSELVIAGLLISSRNLAGALNWTSSLEKTADTKKEIEKGKGQFAGNEILDKTIGIIGVGAIGRKVANVSKALGMNPICFDPFASEEDDLNITNNLDTLLEKSDYVSIHVPFSKNTKGLIGKNEIQKMKDSAVLLNFARDALCDEAEVIKALDENKLKTYVTDFPNDVTLNHKNVISIPHLGASSREAEENCASMAALQLMDFIENGNIKNSVNFPNIDMGEKELERLSFITKELDHNDIKEIVEGLNIEIDRIESVGGNGHFYHLMDINSKVEQSILEELNSKDSIIRVRSL